MTTHNSLSKLTIGLHWIIAITFIGLLATGWYMSTFEAWPLYAWHKAAGVLLLLVAIPRVIWRLIKGWPKALGAQKRLEQMLAKITHWALLCATLIMPFSGMLYSGASGHGVFVYKLQIIPKNFSLENPTEVVPFSQAATDLGLTIHHYMGYTMMLILLLHIAGALKHHVIYKDKTLMRILGNKH